MKTLKIIGSGVLGIAIGALLATGTDFVFERAGVLPGGHLWVSASLIIFVLFYRSVYTALGCYVAAKLTPGNPMHMVKVLGAIGFVVTALSAIFTANMNLGPLWYPWALAILAYPSAWLGGKLYMISLARKSKLS